MFIHSPTSIIVVMSIAFVMQDSDESISMIFQYRDRCFTNTYTNLDIREASISNSNTEPPRNAARRGAGGRLRVSLTG